MSNAEEQISAVLTAEQREKFTKLREENRSLWQPK
jgi:Spy/CpxP family protein refolding chaperone